MNALRRKVLVLNKSWAPCNVVTLRRAINLLCKEYAIIIDPTQEFRTYTWADWSKLRPQEGEDYIAGACITFRIPEVILLKSYNKLPLKNLNFSRRALYKRDQATCQYCGCQPGTEELTIDHIKPKSKGGLTTWENCVICCVSCNCRKSNKTPEQAGMKLRNQPFRPKFNLFKSDVRVESWQSFLGESYWLVELENDM